MILLLALLIAGACLVIIFWGIGQAGKWFGNEMHDAARQTGNMVDSILSKLHPQEGIPAPRRDLPYGTIIFAGLMGAIMLLAWIFVR